MRRVIFIILLVSFTAIYYFSTSHDENSVINQTVDSVRKVINNSTNLSPAPQSDQTGSQNASSDSTSADVEFQADNLQTYNAQQLQTWVQKEASSMNSTNNNTDEKLIQLKAQAQTLTAPQIKSLKERAVNSSLPINERIFSAYLISLNPTEQSLESLFEVAKTEIPNNGALLPHSEAELKNSQETAIRYMQIDELFQRAKTDPNAYDKIKLLAQEAQSAQVRSYADRKLKELKPR
ncbi:hypothetical protein K2P97_09920 [bacterium]|nr:hypothetical protein [bacterium]